MCELSSYIGADTQAQQGLDENPQVQAAVEQVTQPAGGGNGQDNHHAGPDAEGTGQETDDEACNDAIDIELPARQGRRPHGKIMGARHPDRGGRRESSRKR